MEVSVPRGGYEITLGRNSKDPSFPVSLRGVLIMSYSSQSSLPGPFLSRNPGCIFSAVFIFPLSSLAKCEIDVGEYHHFANYKISQPASPTWSIKSLWIVSILKVSKGLYAYVYVWWMYILACDFFGKIVYFSPGNLVGFCLFASSLFYGPVSIHRVLFET